MDARNTKLKGRLERLVLIAVRNIQRQSDKFVTAKEVVDYLQQEYDKKYYPQTITTVLKRLASKRIIDKYSYGANRCAYFDPKLRAGLEGELIWEKFQEFADEFYFGDVELALNKLNQVVTRQIKKTRARKVADLPDIK